MIFGANNPANMSTPQRNKVEFEREVGKIFESLLGEDMIITSKGRAKMNKQLEEYYDTLKEICYREMKAEYTALDITRVAKAMGISVSKEESGILADKFLEKYVDYNKPENEVIMNMLSDFDKERIENKIERDFSESREDL